MRNLLLLLIIDFTDERSIRLECGADELHAILLPVALACPDLARGDF